MTTVLFVLKLAALALLLNVLLRQTYNFIFFLGGRPWVWVVTVTLLGFGIVAIWGLLGWSRSVVAWACFVALFLNVAPSTKGNPEARVAVDDVYKEMGISHGRLKYRMGLVGFAAAAVIAYVLFYGQACNSSGECVPLFRAANYDASTPNTSCMDSSGK